MNRPVHMLLAGSLIATLAFSCSGVLNPFEPRMITAAPADGGGDAGAQDAGAPQDGGRDAGVACTELPPNADPACDACRTASCCAEALACAADPDCRSWLACQDSCTVDDIEGLNTCWSTLPAGSAKAAYMSCMQRSCAGICSPAACGGNYGYFDAREKACRDCRNAHCCAEEAACWQDAECVEALECYDTCPDMECKVSPRCQDIELSQYHKKLSGSWACRNRNCLAECNEDSDCSVVFYSPGDCGTCLHDSCCAEMKACSDDEDCINYALCMYTCGNDMSCIGGCTLQYWMGGGLDVVYTSCRNRHCSGQCGGLPQICGGFIFATSTCQSCMEQSCCARLDSCAQSVDCARMFLCMTGCSGYATCLDKCQAAGTPGGLADYQTVDDCRASQCATDCP